MREEKLKKRKKKKILWILFLFLILVFCYAYFVEVKMLTVREYHIKSGLFKDVHGYKIAQISDIHYGSSTSIEELKHLVSKINLIHPNILIFTGDFIDRSVSLKEEEREKIEATFSLLEDDILLFQVKGEDDIKNPKYDLMMENIGFESLNNKRKLLYLNEEDILLLTGLSSIYDKEEEELEEVEEKVMYSILVMHEPDRIKDLDISSYQMVLAGHSHGGQVRLPLVSGIYYPKYASIYHKDYEKIDKTKVFISRGIGTTKYPIRFLNPPTINVYRLLNY